MQKFRGDYLRQLRKEKKLKQTDLGAALDVSGPVIGSYERENATPSETTVSKMAAFFNVPASNFWQDESGKAREYVVYSQGDLLRLIRDLNRWGARVEILPQLSSGAPAHEYVRITFPRDLNCSSDTELLDALKATKALLEVDNLSAPGVSNWSEVVNAYVDTASDTLSDTLYDDVLPF